MPLPLPFPDPRCKGASALEHETTHLRSFRSHRPAVRFYYPSRTIINRHQLVASPFINTISPCSPLQHIPFLHHHLALHLATLFPSKCHSTSMTTTALDHQFAAHGVKALVSKPCLYHFSQLDPSFVLPSPGPVTSFTPSSPANRRHRVALFVLGKGAPHSSLYF